MTEIQTGQRKHICIFINVDWFFLSHFKDYASYLIQKGYKVTLLTTDTNCVAAIVKLGFEIRTLKLSRGRGYVLDEFKSLVDIYRALKEIGPDYLEMITIKPVLYGGAVSIFLGIRKRVFYISGMGYMYSVDTWMGKIRKILLANYYKLVLRPKSTVVITENEDDHYFFKEFMKGKLECCHLVPGVGVDLDTYAPVEKEITGSFKVLMVSRLLWDKGVQEYCDAAELIHNDYPEIEFMIVGDVDRSNPASLSEHDISKLEGRGVVHFMGRRNDISKIMQDSDIFVLPSYREGFPRVIMEASASGLPVVASNVTGCNSAVDDKLTGILVEKKSAISLYHAIKYLIEDTSARNRMSANARIKAEKEFGVDHINYLHEKAISDDC